MFLSVSLIDLPAIGLPIRAAKPCDIQRRPKAFVSRLMPRSSTIMIERRDTKAAGNGNHNITVWFVQLIISNM